MKKIISAIFISSVFIIQSFACSCMQPESPTKELEKSNLVFIGKVITIETKSSDNEILGNIETNFIDFDVDSVLKGEKLSNITIKTAESSATCGYNFEEDKNYIVYAYDNEGEYSTGLCTRTALLENALDDVEELASQIEAGKVSASDNTNNQSEDSNNSVNTEINNENNMILYSVLLLIILTGLIIIFTKQNKK